MVYLLFMLIIHYFMFLINFMPNFYYVNVRYYFIILHYLQHKISIIWYFFPIHQYLLNIMNLQKILLLIFYYNVLNIYNNLHSFYMQDIDIILLNQIYHLQQQLSFLYLYLLLQFLIHLYVMAIFLLLTIHMYL